MRNVAAEQDGYGPASLQYLRKAIRANRVAFPMPVPVFACQHRADIQWRLVELYFIHGWSCSRLGQRYRVTDRRIQQLIQRWVARAKTLGYLQTIPAEACQEAFQGVAAQCVAPAGMSELAEVFAAEAGSPLLVEAR